jgi:4-hydroxybenzoate polyprenyltransferase/phosphoserine phosphatase
MKMKNQSNNIPLVVDLDGTLINTDLFYEGIISILKKNILYFFLLLPWLLRGKVFIKNKISQIAKIRIEILPYNTELLGFLQNESDNGRLIILATASPISIALEISKIHSVFDKVYGTDNKTNLKGENKLKILLQLFGEKKFDYIGNSSSDLVIFASSRYSYLANASKTLQHKTKRISNLQFTWNSRKGTLLKFIKAIRPHQWVKNLLVFIPLITSHSFNSLSLIFQTFCAFISFSLVASSGYLINDLSDLNSDRSHPRKRLRPLASGQISILSGSFLSLFLLMGGLYLGSKLNYQFLAILISYFIISIAYSLYLKKTVLYDVFILASLYSIRVIAGGSVMDIQLSFWLIAFSTFIFLSLAFVKRYTELMQIGKEDSLANRGRGYLKEDLILLQIMGIISGFSAVIVFSLYINSPEVSQLYSKPKILWALSLLFLFWISRIWLITIHGKMTDDPILFALNDVKSYFIFFIICLIIWISI